MVTYRFEAEDGTKLLFREPGPKDAPELMRFINAFVAERRSGILINKRATLAEEERWLKGWLGDIRAKRGVMLLAESHGKIVGNCTINLFPWKCSHVADFGIALSREVRGKGVGRALMTKAIALARRRMRGIEILELKVFDYNKRAVKLYESLGFVEAGRIPNGVKEGNDYFDDITMIRPL